jgi:uncharacterized protein YbaR (Trm112 family)
MRSLICLGALLSLLGCDPPAPPPGFDTGLLDILACPENLSRLRLARGSELKALNARIQARALKRWSGAAMDSPLEAALIREDGRVAYEIKDGVPNMFIKDALVLDESVGLPDPDKHRK